jgi:GT2 family glycosyltransferase
MISLFARDSQAGVVGTRILASDGALEEAGGILKPGHRLRRGAGDPDPDRPEYSFVRPVDFCSPPMLATQRELFDRLAGFDRQRPADEAVVDYSLRAGQVGTRVLYQPDARVVAMDG